MPSVQPWKTIRLRTVYRNRYFSVREDDVVCPDGTRSTYSYVVNRGGVGVVPIDDDGNVVLIREYKYPVRTVGIHIISGGIERGELPLAAAKRELREETGITARHWRSLGRIAVSDGKSAEYGHLFLAQQPTAHAHVADPREPITTIHVPPREAVAMVLDGRITCSYAIAGIVRAAAALNILVTT